MRLSNFINVTTALATVLLAPNARAFSSIKAPLSSSSSISNSNRNNNWRLAVASNNDKFSNNVVKPSFLPEGIIDNSSLRSRSTVSSTVPSSKETPESKAEYQRGLATIAFITLLFSSNSPVIHGAFINASSPPPVLLLNAATSTIALMGLVTFGPILNSFVPLPKTLQAQESNSSQSGIIVAGTELGLWKTLGTTANLYGLSLTSANHAAFLIQLTTLIVPVVQGAMGIPIPKRIWTAIGLALGGIAMFTQDAAGAGSGSIADVMENSSLVGDVMCAVAAGFYATYDLRLFAYGKKVAPLPLIRTKITVQAMLSIGILAFASDGGLLEAKEYIEGLWSSASTSNDALLIGSAALWSGLAINAVAPFLQVGGQQSVGASRAQVLYASQPLWASILSFILLGETLNGQGMTGAALFLIAIFFAATAESPDPNCGENDCETY